MSRSVKGTLFVDYVRMIRAHKAADWTKHLEPEDLPFLEQRIEPDAWYPMTSFERLGNAILDEVAGGNLELPRVWGRVSVSKLVREHPGVLCPGDPRESLMRLHVLRRTFFDFSSVEVVELHDFEATLELHYYLGTKAEEAACQQAAGFFQGLLEEAGAADVETRLESCTWKGDDKTILKLRWQQPPPEKRQLLLPG